MAPRVDFPIAILGAGFGGIGAAIQQVASDDKVRVSARPVAVTVDNLGILKRLHHRFICAVWVADSDDSGHI